MGTGGLGSVVGDVLGNRRITRLVSAYAAFVLSEYASWIAVTVLAFQRGGATEAGVVSLAQLLPAAVLAPVLARTVERAADRGSSRVRLTGHLVQATGLAVAAVAAAAHLPLVAYAGAVLTSVAVVTTRPAQASSLPSVADTPEQLTAANVALGWVENAAIALAGILAGTLLAVAGPWLTLAVGAFLMIVAALLVAPPREGRTGRVPERRDEAPAGEEQSERGSVRHNEAAVLLLSMLTVQWLVVGALDVLFVVLAVDVMDAGEDWVGYLQASFGAGALLASGLAALLVGRRLGVPILLSALAQGVALVLVVATGEIVVAAGLLAAAGAGRAVLDVSGRTLLQRAVPPHLLSETFGALEGLSMGGRAVGSVLVPVLVLVGGSDAAVAGVAAVVVAAGLLAARPLLSVDGKATVPVVEIALLRSLRLFTGLGPPALEGLARSLERRDVEPGTTLIAEGEVGDSYYVIGRGDFHVRREGRDLGLRGRGDGVGEIALLRDIPRTATITAETDATVYVLDRESFLTAVTGHDRTRDTADVIVEQRLRDEDPAGPRTDPEP